MKKIIMTIFVGTSILLGACNYDTRDSGRSGTYQDDTLENPIKEEFMRYAPALETSNKLIELLKDKQYTTVANDYVLDEIKMMLTEEDIVRIMTKAENKYGKIVSFKEMQWAFEPKVDNGKGNKHYNKAIANRLGAGKKIPKKLPVLFSVKIVEHEKATVSYWFQFPDDGQYDKLLGIFYKERKGVRNVGQF